MGELQITLVDLPPNERVNVIGRIIPKELFLLDYVKPGTSFCFSAVDPGISHYSATIKEEHDEFSKNLN